MRVYDYKPKGWKGQINVKIPIYPQRMKYIKESGLNVGSEVDLADQVEALIKLVEIASKHVEGVKIEKGDEKIESWADLLASDHNDIIETIAAMMIKGGSVGEALGRR